MSNESITLTELRDQFSSAYSLSVHIMHTPSRFEVRMLKTFDGFTPHPLFKNSIRFRILSVHVGFKFVTIVYETDYDIID